jgi:hypothetical protein
MQALVPARSLVVAVSIALQAFLLTGATWFCSSQAAASVASEFATAGFSAHWSLKALHVSVSVDMCEHTVPSVLSGRTSSSSVAKVWRFMALSSVIEPPKCTKVLTGGQRQPLPYSFSWSLVAVLAESGGLC